jgi:hypothetical protein
MNFMKTDKLNLSYGLFVEAKIGGHTLKNYF